MVNDFTMKLYMMLKIKLIKKLYLFYMLTVLLISHYTAIWLVVLFF